MMDPNRISCSNCKAVTIASGETVWVCQNCHTINQPNLNQVISPAPSAPPPDAADVASAQAELNKAVTEALVTNVK